MPVTGSTVEGNVRHPLELSLDDLRALPSIPRSFPSRAWRGGARRATGAACASATSSNGPELLPTPTSGCTRSSSGSRTRRPISIPAQAHDVDTLLALEVNGEPLHLDHGYPLRLIGPNRPGVNQTKWVTRLVVS